VNGEVDKGTIGCATQNVIGAPEMQLSEDMLGDLRLEHLSPRRVSVLLVQWSTAQATACEIAGLDTGFADLLLGRAAAMPCSKESKSSVEEGEKEICKNSNV